MPKSDAERIAELERDLRDHVDMVLSMERHNAQLQQQLDELRGHQGGRHYFQEGLDAKGEREAALEQARREQHAECVRLLREDAFGSCGLAEWDCDTMADWLERQKP